MIQRITGATWRFAVVARRHRRAIVACTLMVALAAGALGVFVALPLAPAELAPPASPGVVVLDRHGAVLRATRAHDGAMRRWVALGEMAPELLTAFVAAEDKRYWDHHGIDLIATVRAAVINVRRGRVVSGASTISMQLARLMRPAARGWSAKAAQAAFALRLDAHLSKQEQLEQYLNRVHLGQGTIGVGAAADLYFGAVAGEVSLGQAALLAGLAHAPSRDNPHASRPRARAARARTLLRMQRLHLITRDEAARAANEPVSSARLRAPFRAAHFTTRVLAWNEAGEANTVVRTTLDGSLQESVEADVRHTVSELRDRGVAHAAAIVLDNRTGDVVAWTGSPDFWEGESGQTDMVISARQPGSALKPFLYGAAFDRGFTAASILADVPVTYATTTGPYRPRNYDRRFRGPVRARESLASSYNVPAVELARRVGPPVVLATLRNAGFASLSRDASYYGLGLALGNGDVTLLELANGYRALANSGVWTPWRWSPATRPAESRRVMSAVASALVLDVLSDPVARIPGFGIETPFDFPFAVAVKTGTSRHFTDNWAIGVTEGFTVAVWAGNFSGKAMEGVSGVTGAGPLLHRVVMNAAQVLSPGALPGPGTLGAKRVTVCRLSGLRATSRCARLDEWFAPGTEPTETDTWESGGSVRLPAEFAEWSREPLAVERPTPQVPMPEAAGAEMNVTRVETAATKGFYIASPRDGDRYSIPPGIEAKYATIALRASGTTERLAWTIDGAPFGGTRWTLSPGSHTFAATARSGQVARATISVEQ